MAEVSRVAVSGTSFMPSFGYPEMPGALTWAKRVGGRKQLGDIVHLERW